MDFLNRAYAQLLPRYRAMTPGSRWMLALLSAVVLACAGYLYKHQETAADEDLMDGVAISPGQLPRMLAAFKKAGLIGFEQRNDAIYVPRGQRAAYMTALVDAKAVPPNLGDALREAIDAGAFYENTRQREGRIQIALQETVAQMICAMPGIDKAYVIYGVDTKPGFNREKIHTAVANVKPTGSRQLDEERVNAIRSAVVGSFPGLKPEEVTVLDLNGRAWEGKSEVGRSDEENRCIARKRAYEQELKYKILGALKVIPNVTVVPNVVLASEWAPSRKDAASSGKDRDASTAKETPQRVPASDALQPNTASILGALLGDDRRTEPAPRGPTEREEPRMAVASVRVSIVVPTSYFKSIWLEQNPSEPGRPPRLPDQAALDQIRIVESMKIQHHVAQLLPPTDGAATASIDQVTVTTLQDVADVAASPAPAASLDQEAIRWLLRSWPKAGLVGLALLGLLALLAIVRSGNASETKETSETDRTDESSHEPHAAVPPPHARRFRSEVPSVHRDISEFVEEDPDAAANVLRNWIGHAG